MLKKFPYYHQPDAMDCGPTCLRIIAKYYGRNISLSKLRALSETTREGSNLKNLANSAEKIGFRTLGVQVTLKKLVEEAPLPCIVYWQQKHFVVVYSVSHSPTEVKGLKTLKRFFFAIKWVLSGSKTLPKGEDLGGAVFVSDPAHGLLRYTQEEFIKNWIGNNANEHTKEGIALLLEPTPKLTQAEYDDFPHQKSSGAKNSSSLGGGRGSYWSSFFLWLLI